jgi:hypothetical protein
VPERIRLRRTRGWRLPPGAVSVARPTKWGNPFVVGEAIERDSPLWPYIAQLVPGGTGDMPSVTPLLRETVVTAHGWWFIEQPHLMLTVAEELGGRDLACWCPLPAPGEEDICHAAFLLAMANDLEPGHPVAGPREDRERD